MNATKLRIRSYAENTARDLNERPLARAVLACTSDRELSALADRYINRHPKQVTR